MSVHVDPPAGSPLKGVYSVSAGSCDANLKPSIVPSLFTILACRPFTRSAKRKLLLECDCLHTLCRSVSSDPEVYRGLSDQAPSLLTSCRLFPPKRVRQWCNLPFHSKGRSRLEAQHFCEAGPGPCICHFKSSTAPCAQPQYFSYSLSTIASRLRGLLSMPLALASGICLAGESTSFQSCIESEL